MIGTVWPMAWRWQQLLSARGIHDRLSWLTRAYFVAYTAGQLLPTAVGGDAVRIYETARRHPGEGGAGRRLGAARAGARRRGHARAGGGRLRAGDRPLPVGAYLWIEGAFVVATFFLAIALFSRRARPLLAKTVPFLRLIRVERPIRAAYEGIHAYRDHPGLLVGVFTLTLACPDDPRAGDLARRPRGRRRPLAAAVLRDGAAALPRPAAADLGERDRRARVVLRQLPRPPRRQRRQGVRDRFPVLRRDALPVGARRGVARLAEPARPHASRASAVATSPSQRAALGRAGARERAAATRRSSSTTARPTARSSSCASAFPTRA